MSETTEKDIEQFWNAVDSRTRRYALADELERQFEECYDMGEPPSCALQRHEADELLRLLRSTTC